VFPPIKTAEFEVKNRHKSGKEAKAEHLLFITFVIFRSQSNRNALDNSISIGGNNNAGLSAPSRWTQMGVLGRIPRSYVDFCSFFNFAFL